MSVMRWTAGLLATVLLGCADGSTAPGPRAPAGWDHWAGDPGSRRYAPVEELTPATAPSLETAWSWSTGERGGWSARTEEWVSPGKFEATPLAFGDTLFLTTPFNRAVALDGRTGEELWAFDPGAADWGPIANDHAGFVHRGLASWEGPGGRRLFYASRWELLALDAADGSPVEGFGEGGRVNLVDGLRWPVDRLLVGNTSPPVVWEDVVVVGSAVGDQLIFDRDPPGALQAFDAVTGRSLWSWDPMPAPGTPARDTWGGKSAEVTGHMNVWTPMSVDPDRGLLYAAVSAASNDWYGGRRPGDNLYSQSLVCLDLRTGELQWYRQVVRHDLWDYDPPSPPVLVEMEVGEGPLPAVLLPTKMGYLFAFHRLTGEPVWPLEDRPAPASDVPGEVTAATQPHPTWPPPFVRQGFGPDDVVDFTPEIRARAREILEGRRTGPLYTPPSLEGTVVMPGWIGGAGWGSTAVDPARGLVFVKGSREPVLARLVATGDERGFRLDSLIRNPIDPLRVTVPGGRRWGIFPVDSLTVPIVKPPYGNLTAYDLDTGEIVWQIPLGDTPGIRDHPRLRHLDLPPLGVAGAPGGVATEGGLVFVTGGGHELLAVASETGEVVWSAPLDAMGYSNPMVYRAEDGRPYVVVATGAGRRARLQAFRLPDPPNPAPDRRLP